MIELTPNTAVVLYLFLTVSMILGIWLYQHLHSKRQKGTYEKEKLYRCEYCHFTYLARCPQKITRCPQCHSYNKD